MATPENKTKLTVDIPSELKQDLKVYCAMNRVNMTVIVEQLIREFLDQNQEKEVV
jgi:hypothetical protein